MTLGVESPHPCGIPFLGGWLKYVPFKEFHQWTSKPHFIEKTGSVFQVTLRLIRKGKRERDFCELLIDIFEHLKPAVTIIDGVVAMDGAGPISGRARALGWIIGGTEPMALETICCKLVNIKPDELPIIKTARQMRLAFSDKDNIKILGEDFPESICTDFELPELVPLRFSLLHVCKSIGKQIILLAKAAIKRTNRREHK